MKVFVPEYYKKFKCIADKCKHNCCIGWEIDVDEKALSYYKSLNNNFGRRLINSISYENDVAYFKLTDDFRCPMLNSRNLCDVILNIGEKNLCQICTDHPRFRNFFSDRTEVGIGISCEAACEIILFNPNIVELVQIDGDYNDDNATKAEEEFYEKRQIAFKIAQDRTINMEERVERLLNEFSIKIPTRSMFSWSRALLSLEELNEEWTNLVREYLNDNCKSNAMTQMQWEMPFEQLLIYLLFRHTADFPDKIEAGISFSVLWYRIIKSICANIEDKHQMFSPDIFIEICRLFSSEIEYSQENMNAIYGFLDM